MEGEEGSSSWLLRPKLSTSVYKKSSSCRESSLIIMKSSAEPKLDSSSSSSSTSQPRSSSTELSSALSLPSSTTPPPGSETEKVGSSSTNSTSKPKPALKNLESTSGSSSSSCSFSFYPDGCPELSSKFSDTNLPPTPSIIMAKPGLDARSREPRSENAPPKPRQRSSSPMPPATILSDAFKEAKSVGRKRFSTPPRSRHSPPADHRDSSPMRYLSSMKAAIGKPKARGGRPSAAAESGEEPTTIDLCKLYIGLRFASGAHSRLYHGMYEEQPVAAKIVRQPDDDDDGAMAARLEKQFTREVTFLSRLSHRNVIKLAGACKTPQISCIITEYLSGGSLRAFLHKLEHKSLPLKEMIAIGLQIARGLEYIHSQGIIHRDIKPENILFDRDSSCVKIADFGTACEEAHCDVLADDPGTYRWMAPEMLKHKAYGRKVDVYSFGLILWEMAAGTIPCEDMSPIQAAFAVVNKNMRPKIPACCPAAVQALIEQCWALHPEKRPEFSQIVKVLEQFESKFAREGTLDQLQNLTCLDHKKGLHNWIQKFKPLHADVSGPTVPKLL